MNVAARLRPQVAFLTIACALAACHTTTTTTASVDRQPAPAPAIEPAAVIELEPSPTRALLERDVPHAAGITEVVLDPRGQAALTLDADGGVRLWPDLRADPATSKTYRIPVHEPLWLSIAQHEQGFLLGFVGTNNAGTVYRVELPSEGPASIVESFALSPEDPLLELHALDGGERLLALGVDHRVRLYAADGALISALDERGFGPWQLRVSGAVGEPPKLAAVLAQPLRVQAIELVDDRLELVGTARPVELDRGPNRNDLALSPDGRTVAALRRPHKHDRQWSVELIDLATDERELIAGRTDTRVRPRMHFWANDQLLLESGSGQAWLVDLDAAARPRRASDLDPDSDYAKRLARRLEHRVVTLPASGESRLDTPDDDTGVRMHASVVNGVRAGVEAGRRLVVGPVDQAAHRSFAQREPKLVDAAFDASGATVIWAGNSSLFVERVGDPASLVEREHGLGLTVAVALSRPDHAVVLTRSNKAGELDLRTGEVVASADLPVGPAYQISTRMSASGADAQLGYLSDDDDAPIWLLEFSSGLAARVATTAELETWGDLRGIDSASTRALCEAAGAACPGGARFIRDLDGRPIHANWEGIRRYDVERSDEWVGVDVPGETLLALTASPVAPIVAVANRVTFEADTTLISTVDTRTLELAWTTTVATREVTQLRWSANGKHLAVIGDGHGRVLDATTGEQLHERVTLGLDIATITSPEPEPEPR